MSVPPPPPGYAESGRLWVDCTADGCKVRETIRVDVLNAVPDDEAARWFESMGWSIRPTLCPGHVSQGSA